MDSIIFVIKSFESPMDLHYSQTLPTLIRSVSLFESPMDLHYSQTQKEQNVVGMMFESPMDLHYSQTVTPFCVVVCSLNPLWIYTTLKRAIRF